jgi:hypothetical protein
MADSSKIGKELRDLCILMLELLKCAKDSGSIDEETYLPHVKKEKELLEIQSLGERW